MDRGALALRRFGRAERADLMREDARARRDAFLGKIGSRALIMGILNLTPDSFSDGGRFLTRDAAIAQAKRMVAEGCDIVDVGGESTRPGAAPVPEAEELARVEPILAELARELDAPVSIDTYKAAVAERAAELGAVLVNDVWGLQKDPRMAETVAAAGTAVVVMHNRLEKDADVDILSDIRRFFDRSLALAETAGIARERIILDPGVGFGKTSRQNLEAVAGIGELRDYGLPVLIGVSRKSFLGSLLEVGTEGRLIATIAANLAAAAGGAAVFRVHDVAEHVAALKVFETIRGAGPISRTR
jgi:dihydropteroate synthase